MQATLEARIKQLPGSGAGVRQDRHRRGRHRSDAADRRRHLRHAEGPRGLARPAQAEGASWWPRSQEAVEAMPGNNYEFTQPIEMRFNELIVRRARRRRGQGLRRRPRTAGRDRRGHRDGASRASRAPQDVSVEQVTGLPVLQITPDRAALARYGLNVARRAGRGARLASAAPWPARCSRATAASTSSCGCRRTSARQVGRRSARLRVPLPRDRRRSPRTASCRWPTSPRVERRDRAQPDQPRERQAPRRGHRQRARPRPRLVRRRGPPQGRAQGSTLPPGYWISYGGTFEQLISAAKRLAARRAARAAADLRACCSRCSGSVKDAPIVFTGVPLALTGGVAALLLRGMPLSISAGVGFIALSGVAVLNGVVMVAFIRSLRARGPAAGRGDPRGRADAPAAGADDRAGGEARASCRWRFNVGAGAEVQRPLATVVIGGDPVLDAADAAGAAGALPHRACAPDWRRSRSAPGVPAPGDDEVSALIGNNNTFGKSPRWGMVHA